MPYKDPERAREHRKAYSDAHKVEKREYNAAYWQANRDRLSQANAEYRTTHKEDVAVYLKAWRSNNQSKIKIHEETKAQRRQERLHSDEEYRQGQTEYSRRWRSANKDRCYAAELRWREKNPEKVAAKNRRHRLNSPSSRPEYQRLKYKTDPDYRARIILKVLNRSARKKGAGGTYKATDIQRIWERQQHKCAVPGCTNPISDSGPSKYHIDHIQAIVNGGSNWPENIQLLCQRHNLTKQAKDEYGWAQSLGMLFVK